MKRRWKTELTPKRGNIYRMVNAVVSTRFDGFVDIEKLALAMPGSQYEPEVFPGLIMRRPDVGATLVLFSTGRCVSMARTVKTATEALERIATEISVLENRTMSLDSPRVENMVATMDLGFRIDLDRLAKADARCVYDPEQFCAVICHLEGSVVLLVFASGKVNCVGARRQRDILRAIEWLKETLMTQCIQC